MTADSSSLVVGCMYGLDWLVFGFKRTPNNEAFQNVSARKIRGHSLFAQVPAISKFTEEDFLCSSLRCDSHVSIRLLDTCQISAPR
jgi:hypothetical protein